MEKIINGIPEDKYNELLELYTLYKTRIDENISNANDESHAYSY